MTDPSVFTSIFKVSHALFLSTIAGRTGQFVVWGTVIITVVATAVGIAYDLRWIIVALMFLMIVAPMLMALLYINRGILPASASNITLHSIEISPFGVRISLFEEGEKSEEKKKDDKDEKKEEYVSIREMYIPKDKISAFRANSSSLLLTTSEGGFIIIPYSSFQSSHDLSRAIGYLKNN